MQHRLRILDSFGLCVFLCSLLLLTGSLHASDGPPIGVALVGGTNVLVSPGGGDPLWVESQSLSRRLLPQQFKLEFEGNTARLGPLTFTGEPFRMRGAEKFQTQVLWPGGPGGKAQGHTYEGWIEVLPPETSTGVWRIVNRLPIERYLLGVVGSEVYASWEPAVLEAQAIAARTYALYKISRRPPGARYHIRSGESAQVYRGLDGHHENVVQAVQNTRGAALTFDGKVFQSFFHAICGGGTTSAWLQFGYPDIAPLRGVKCNYCRNAKRAKPWEWRVSGDELQSRLQRYCKRSRSHRKPKEIGTIQKVRGIEPGTGGQPSYVQIEHATGSFEFDAHQFRMSVVGTRHLPSSLFRCRKDGADFVFHGRGWGHGVGMCQWGAKELAERGRDAATILQFYYPQSKILVLWD